MAFTLSNCSIESITDMANKNIVPCPYNIVFFSGTTYKLVTKGSPIVLIPDRIVPYDVWLYPSYKVYSDIYVMIYNLKPPSHIHAIIMENDLSEHIKEGYSRCIKPTIGNMKLFISDLSNDKYRVSIREIIGKPIYLYRSILVLEDNLISRKDIDSYTSTMKMISYTSLSDISIQISI